jgi:hypothetical protein
MKSINFDILRNKLIEAHYCGIYRTYMPNILPNSLAIWKFQTVKKHQFSEGNRVGIFLNKLLSEKIDQRLKIIQEREKLDSLFKGRKILKENIPEIWCEMLDETDPDWYEKHQI